MPFVIASLAGAKTGFRWAKDDQSADRCMFEWQWTLIGRQAAAGCAGGGREKGAGMWDRVVAIRVWVGKLLTVGIAAAIAVAMVWRGVECTGTEPITGMVPPVMCSLFGLSCLLTGISLAFGDEDTEATG